MNNQTVYVIDDNNTFRQSTAWLLGSMGHTVVDFDDPVAGLNALTENRDCDCLLMDMRMPNMSGLDVHDKLIKGAVDVPVIYMTGHGDVALAVEAMKKGAITLLEKPLDKNALVSAIERAAEQRSNKLCLGKARENALAFQRDLKKLTPRELEVMHEIVEGKANKVIAFDLNISPKTVELHRSRVMRKLPIRSSQELVKMVMLCQ